MNVSIIDVANYFISLSLKDEENTVTQLKLQKLCYYAQAWSLVWDNKKLFDNKFEAWVHGPANLELYHKYKSHGINPIESIDNNFNKQKFTKDQIETMNAVWDAYGRYTGKYLEQLTHQELPWREARGNHAPGDICKNMLSEETMKNFYTSLMS